MARRLTWISPLFLRTALGLFFLYAGGSKLLDVPAFTRAIEAYQVVGFPFSYYAALGVPWLECVAAVGMWLPRWRHAGLLILFGLLVLFQGILLAALVRGLDISCGCLGGGLDSSVSWALVRNCVLLGLIGIQWHLEPRRR
jgi:uncharacterized membrane protein YphA (DoxX/SURF4 family)